MAQQTMGPLVTFVADEALEAYRQVRFTAGSTTNVVYADAGEEAIGVVQEEVEAAGEFATVRMLTDSGTFKLVAAGAFSLGDKLFPAADGKVDDDSTTGGSAAWEALEAASGDGSVIEARPLGAVGTGSRLAFAAAAPSIEVENTITETAFATTYTEPLANLETGDILEILATATVNDNNSTDTLAIKLKVGTEVIVAPAAFDAADGDIVQIHAFVRIDNPGASATLTAHGSYVAGVPGTAVPTPFTKASAAEDLSSGAAITLTATWSVAHVDNEVELTDLTVIHHRQ